ncbi:MAG: sigma-70 family RNA polymerase sigma factor [Verrucomicrobia bacterium]|nr:sigma-70 family RNA polymerase sigma factor [Verrucomicrobiota bacterium]
MNEQTDSQLLRAYAEHRSELAFAELVRRHVDFVYSAARRMICDPHLAEDVTQGVFVALAKSARQLTDRSVLSSWLHRTAQNIAAQTVRTTERRRAREQEAAAMNELLSAESDAVWENIAPHLDAALGELNEADRDALLLRYFERKSAREMAQTLGINDDAAQKRVSRAVERLREFFARRGVTVGASGLVVVLSANAVQAAPVGLAVTISTSAVLAGKTIAAATTVTAVKTIAMTTLQKTLVGATLAAAVGTGIYEARQASRLREENQSLQQSQASLAEQNQRLLSEHDEVTRQLAALRDENERLNRNANELLKLRGEVAQLRKQAAAVTSATATDEHEWVDATLRDLRSKLKLIKQRFDEWPGKKTPELQLLNGQDWLNEIAKHDLDSDVAYRKAMSELRNAAKKKFAHAVNEALEEFAKSNNEKFPSALSQLAPYLKSPVDSILEGYEIAKPGWVIRQEPGSPIPERAEPWALLEKGAFTPDGIPIRDGNNLADPDYDMYFVVYQNGFGFLK